MNPTKLIYGQEQKIKDLLEQRNLFTEIIAHDLQHPLVAITMLSKLLLQPATREQGKIEDISQMIHDAGMEMITMLRNYIDSNRYATQGFKISTSVLNLTAVVQQAVARFKPLADKKNITLHFTGDATKINTDIFCLVQIIENLLSNAIKYTAPYKNIFISVGMNQFTIRDEGVGIKKNELPLLFQKFQKLSSRPTGCELSTGLGLHIVKFLADKTGVTIEVNSRWKKGTSFTLYFPAA